jgi:hypothetical protein
MTDRSMQIEMRAAVLSRLGAPYAWHEWHAMTIGCPTPECNVFGTGPAFDCSGLMVASAADVAGVRLSPEVSIPRHLKNLGALARGIAQSQLRYRLDPDEVCAIHLYISEINRPPTHAALALRDPNGPALVHALHKYSGREYDSVIQTPYYASDTPRLVLPVEVLVAAIVEGRTE